MKANGQLSGVLHVLLHMVGQPDPITSEMLAKLLATNPVVIRRILAGLRDKGYVRSEKGHGGGWVLACNPQDVTLRDIYSALGCPSLLAVRHWNEEPGCLVEKAVHDALSQAFKDAETLLLRRLGDVTLAKLGADVHAGIVARRELRGLETTHHHRQRKRS
jgi:DNA-binding IscR family transcriptional regulator